jgi:hypothetical protein
MENARFHLNEPQRLIAFRWQSSRMQRRCSRGNVDSLKVAGYNLAACPSGFGWGGRMNPQLPRRVAHRRRIDGEAKLEEKHEVRRS